MHVCGFLWRPEETIGSPGAGGRGDCELPNVGILSYKPSSPGPRNVWKEKVGTFWKGQALLVKGLAKSDERAATVAERGETWHVLQSRKSALLSFGGVGCWLLHV